MEYRAFRADDVAEDEGKLSGLAAPFGKVTQIGSEKWGFREEIAKGAFAKSIQERDVVMLDNHDPHRPLARKSAGTLTLRESAKGLEFEAQLADTSYARDVLTNVRAGNIGGMSFGFEVIKDDWYNDRGEAVSRYDGVHRILREVKLFEISDVTFPAYDATNLSARDMVSAAREAREEGDGEDRSPKPYGNVAYADPKNGKYPIDTKEHAKAAWSYIHQAKNAAKYTAAKLAKVKARIKAALTKFGVKVSEENAEQLALEWRDLLTNYCVRCGIHEDESAEGRDGQEPDSSTPDEADAEALEDWAFLKRHELQAATFRAEAVN